MKKITLWLIALAALCGLTSRAENRALLVGVSRFRSDRIPQLPGIDKDINMMHQIALTLGFKESQIKTLRDQEATLEGVRGGFKWLIANVGPNDEVLIYFSSHGSYVKAIKDKEEETGNDQVIVTYDTTIVDAQPALTNMMIDDEVGELL